MKIIFLLSLFLLCSTCHNPSNTKYWDIIKDKDIWWLTNPNGDKTFFLGVTSIRHIQYGINEPHYKSLDYKGDIDKWAKEISKKVLDTGFDGSGAWSDPAVHKYLPYTKDLNLSLNTNRPISDPLWEKDVEQAIIAQVKPEDQNLIGYFTDNEINWHNQEDNAEKYFEVTHRLLRKYDPNHLILGVRFNTRPSIKVLKASIGKVDAHSFNCYTDNGKLWRHMFKETYEITGRPIIISEFSFFAAENNSNNPNCVLPHKTQPFGGGVKTQQDRADMFKSFVENTAGCSFIIGVEWFQWNDEPPSGRSSDGESYNFGVVDIQDRSYDLLIRSIKEVSKTKNSIHLLSNDKQQGNIWAEDKPANDR